MTCLEGFFPAGGGSRRLSRQSVFLYFFLDVWMRKVCFVVALFCFLGAFFFDNCLERLIDGICHGG